jgi:hypothetical protein
MTCQYCSLRCIATGCECLCHDEDMKQITKKKKREAKGV